MLAERSNKMRMESGAGESAQPSQPPANGRLIKSTSIRTANTRKSRINHWRSLAWLVELRLAETRNIMAAQG